MRQTTLLVLMGLVLSSAIGNAQDVARLRATKTFRCTFAASASANMDGDVPKLTTRVDHFELVFDQIDLERGTARLIGNVGAEDVTVIGGSERLSLLEHTGSGNLQVTVIYMAQRSDGQFKAVHSRHTALLGGLPLPSQTYGSCRPLV
ncbi:MAG: hypothetical protein ACYC3F_05635 [Gemmatimonadaceae bacterium]